MIIIAIYFVSHQQAQEEVIFDDKVFYMIFSLFFDLFKFIRNCGE